MAEPNDNTPDIAATKKACRDAGRAVRCALPLDACRVAAQDLAARLLALPELAAARLVLVYSSTADEISLAPAIAGLRERGVEIAYPRIEEAGVLAVHIADESELVPGPFGIREPPADARRPAPESVDVVIVPGVAFDERGVRVGFGGGFYDRLLPLLPRALRVGVAFDEQLTATPVPRESHDVAMDVVVTPSQEIRPISTEPPARRG